MIVGFKTLSLRSKRYTSTHDYTFAHVHTKHLKLLQNSNPREL